MSAQAPHPSSLSQCQSRPVTVFYREAGNPQHPTLLLLHGFPTSSHMFRDLIPLVADRYHVVAPDLPGFGFSTAPDRKAFCYSFDNLAKVIENFTDAVGLSRYAIYVFDYGAPVLSTAAACGMGQERSVLPSARCRSLQAAQSQCGSAVLRHRAFRSRNSRLGDSRGDARLFRTNGVERQTHCRLAGRAASS
jgi:alpha-beta hydrolase superfamily lysophospholipase